MLTHIITLCIGFIIAYGLQRLYETFQRRHRIRKAAAEIAANASDRNPRE